MGNTNSSTTSRKSATSPVQIITDTGIFDDRLAESQVILLRDKFSIHGPNGSLDLLAFSHLLGGTLPKDLVQSLFRVFTHEKTISWQQLCYGYCRYIFASHSEQAGFLVDIFCPPGKASIPPKSLRAFREYVANCLKDTKTFDRLDTWIKAKKAIPVEEVKVWALDCLRLRLALRPLELIPLPRTESEQVKALLKTHQETRPGSRCCVISARWVQAWKDYVQFDDESMIASLKYYTGLPVGERPVEINNSGLLQDAFQLREDIVKGRDFEIIPEVVWDLLYNWYDGGPKILREAVLHDDLLELELYPLVFEVSLDVVDPRTAVTFLMSKNRRVSDVIAEAANRLKQPHGEELKLYSVTDTSCQQLHSHMTLGNFAGKFTCVLSALQYDDTLPTDRKTFNLGDQLEFKQGQRWVSCVVAEVTPSKYVLTSGTSSFVVTKDQADQVDQVRPPTKVLVRNPVEFGVNGIVNIGNTCYAAAVIQALAHTPLLGSFFASNRYASHLLPAATAQDGLCELFAKLLQSLSSQRSAVKPTYFLNKFARAHKQFSGWNQQDSHEFLRALLDSLHKEIMRSPHGGDLHTTCSVTSPTPEREEQVAMKQWSQIRGESGSAISDFCIGQIRRILNCPWCNMTVQIFESFMDLSLPLPAAPAISIQFVLLNEFDTQLYVFYYVDSLDTLYSKLEAATGLLRSQMLAAHIKHQMITRLIHQPQDLDNLKPPQGELLYFYQVLASVEEAEAASKPTRRAERSTSWRDCLADGQLVDFQLDSRWVVGEVLSARAETVCVRLYVNEDVVQEVPRSHPSLAEYRGYSRNNDEILCLPLLITCGTYDVFMLGSSLILSIGNWLTWQDFDKAVASLCVRYLQRGPSDRRLYSLTINSSSTHACAWCGVIGCPEYHFSRSWATLSWLSDHKDSVYIRVHWNEVAQVMEPRVRRIEEPVRFTLADCFQQFTTVETVERTCSGCGNPEMTSRWQICRLPDILILHLKRFSYTDKRPVKKRSYVSFPIEGLDLTKWSDARQRGSGCTVDSAPENFQFDLYAVVNHLGTIQSGHYTAACLTSQNGWLHFNDNTVHQFTQNSEVVTPHGYILFYRRKRFTSSHIVSLAL